MATPADVVQGELLTSPARLRKIDLLRDKNIGAYLPLPQLVAVGDQSSGKSSLLEGLTGIPFPRGQGLCTRYATQITHRRESKTSINISIIPGPNASESEKLKLEEYQKSVSTTSELKDQLSSILLEVNERMGVCTSQNPKGTKTFTEDVLKIEKCGPNEDYLTVIDVPGLFEDTKHNSTTETDKAMVQSMVRKYICNDQTVILAVLPCFVDFATQKILALAEEYDPNGERTLGILTKPDLLVEESGKNVVCSLVRGEQRPLNLGYHLVRSRGGDDKGKAFSDEARDSEFKKKPRCTLPPDRLGVVALRQRLQHLLGDLTDKAFPKLRSKTRKLLRETQEQLANLGHSRQTMREQQLFLVSIASEFQRLVRAAVNADYSSSPVFDDDKFRLITNVLNATDDFKSDFTVYAHTYEFLPSSEEASEEESTTSEPRGDHERKPFELFPDLDGVIVRDRIEDVPKEGIMEWLKHSYYRSRGSQLLPLNPMLFSGVFREQTSGWTAQTVYYVSRVIYTIHDFFVGALEAVCSDKRAREELLSQILEQTLARYAACLQQAKFLVNVEREAHPCTLNSIFRSKLAELQSMQMEEKLTGKTKNLNLYYTEDKSEEVITMDDVLATLRDKDRGKYVAEDIHDVLKSYYEVARDRFIDTVYLQVVTHNLVSGGESPLMLFSERWVLDLEPEKLESIAGESLQKREQREMLARRIQDLTDAVVILR
ncbi:dynamin family protein [Beauveria bassiana ARSEF 2860]|uniref:Dynamin family protein n=1 Tax=Beauveria bassiana (strain ARSEF 2860) TaxID=655819 RepID=J4UQF8_BEAB2|nr:dynamin family protein [Beauveria bassiana ARSEF 2860]EJP67592.1 dynamin family protein [Beauveria bassiana ARSEF 2860]